MTQFNHETDRIRREFAEQSREITSLRQQLHELQERQAKLLEAALFMWHETTAIRDYGHVPSDMMEFNRHASVIREARAAAAIAEEHAK